MTVDEPEPSEERRGSDPGRAGGFPGTGTPCSTRLDRDIGNGMGVAIGRLRPDALFDYRFVSLSHNTVRGAAGGAVLTAELLTSEGYIQAK